jgi:predicted  nucleic acid-binding Zn-ribbon protein
MDHPFRRAIFGGFNRQDVLNYLEYMSKENEKKVQELQQQLAQLQGEAAQHQARFQSEEEQQQAQLTQQSQQLDQQRQRLDGLTQERDSLNRQLEQANLDLSACQSLCVEQSDQLEQAQKELTALRRRVAALEPDASAYAAVKDRTAGMELEAHRRAQGVQEQSERQARQMHHDLELWFQNVVREYTELRAKMDSAVAQASDQMDLAGKNLEQVTTLMQEQEVVLNSLSQEHAASEPTST